MIVSLVVIGASIDCEIDMPDTSIDGKVRSLQSNISVIYDVAHNNYAIFTGIYSLEFIVVRVEYFRCVHIDGNVPFWIGSLLQFSFGSFACQLLVLFTDFARRFGAMHNFPALRFQAFDTQRIVDGSFMWIRQHFIGTFCTIEQQFSFSLAVGIDMFIGMVDAT